MTKKKMYIAPMVVPVGIDMAGLCAVSGSTNVDISNETTDSDANMSREQNNNWGKSWQNAWD